MKECMEKQEYGQPAEQPQMDRQAAGQTVSEETAQTAKESAARPEQDETQSRSEGQNGSAEQAEQDAPAVQVQPDELALLQIRLAAAEADAKQHYDLLLRERAELENFKRRMQREKSESLRFANEPLLRDILPVIDNLERAVEHAKGNEGGQALVEGVELVLRSLLDTIGRHGVRRVLAKGETFDPSQHDAVAQVENAEVAPHTVLDEHQPGYQLHDRLLRPAMVSVSKAPPQARNEEEEESES